MTTVVEFAGQDLAEAIAAAAGALNLPPEKLKFNVIEMGTKGFLGLGRRRARIAVDPADPALYIPEDKPVPQAEAPSAEESPAEVPPDVAAVLEPGPPPPDPSDAPEEPAPKSNSARPAPGAPVKAPARPRPLPTPELMPLTRPAAGETRVDNPEDEAALLARTVVENILSRMGLVADLSLTRLGSRLVVNLDGPDRALLIGARGATLEALQLLAAKIMAQKKPDEGGRLVVDVADYRFRRHTQVLDNLKTQAEAARRTGQPQPLTALSAAERRLVRLALRSFKDLDLKAGRGRESLVLSPAAPKSGARRRRKMKGAPR
jgi:spoIIIJ-associated protein